MIVEIKGTIKTEKEIKVNEKSRIKEFVKKINSVL